MKRKILLHKDEKERENLISDPNLAYLQVLVANLQLKLSKGANFAYSFVLLIILCILTMVFFVERLTGQIVTPKFESFKPINIGDPYYTNSTQIQSSQQVYLQNYPVGATAQDIIDNMYSNMSGPKYKQGMTLQERDEANMRYIQQRMANDPAYQMGNNNNRFSNNAFNLHQELLNILNELHPRNNSKQFDMSYYKSADFLNKSKSFTDAFNILNNMLTDKTSLSISKSYFTIENAYGNTYLTEKEYNNIINQSAKFIKQWLIQKGFNPTKNEDLHYGIQKFMKDTLTVTIKQPENKFSTTTTHYPFTYDYNDFQVEKDFQNYFVSKCLATGTGQCNSLPATYLAIAEKLGAKAYLSFAPQHSFIKYPDIKGGIHAYEPTSNWKISDKWYVEHMGISPSAIASGIYLDTLNKKMIVANCMLDLAFGYMKKFGVADGKFVIDCINTSMKYYPYKNNITAYFLKKSLIARQIDNILRKNGITDMKNLSNVNGAVELYQELMKNEQIIQNLGFRDMPEEMYLQMMQVHEFKGKLQQNYNTKQKRNLFSTSIK